MGKLVVSEFVSLDGVIQGPGGPDEDRRGGFAHGGWAMGNGDDGEFVTHSIRTADAFLLGRFTYQIFASYWPQQTGENNVIAKELNGKPKYVVSTTLSEQQINWQGTTLIHHDVAAAIGKLKQQTAGDILVIGSSLLVQSLIAYDLVDEYRLIVYPVLLGGGKRLFGEEAAKRTLRLAASQITPRGLAILTYQRA